MNINVCVLIIAETFSYVVKQKLAVVFQNASELTVTTGSKVIFVRTMAKGYIQVVEEGTKKYGLIPASCVQKYVPQENPENILIDFL